MMRLRTTYVIQLIGKILTERKIKGDIILTASTEEFQQLVLQFAQDDKVFPNPTKLTCVKFAEVLYLANG